jgi:hypothetical protein
MVTRKPKPTSRWAIQGPLADRTLVAKWAGTTPGMVRHWERRHVHTYPAPVQVLAIGPVWSWPAVAAWLHSTGRLPKHNAPKASAT